MNTIIQKNPISVIANHIVLFVIATSIAGVFPILAHAQDYGFSYYEPSASAVDYGSSYYQQASTPAADYGYSYYEPNTTQTQTSSVADYGYSYYEPNDYGYSYYAPNDYGYSYYAPNDYGYSYYEPNGGTSIDPNASTIDANASSIDRYASSIDANASSVYSTTYSVYSVPSYDYGYSYGANYGYAALGYGLGYALGYGLTYPHYSYQNYPVVASAPSNTSVYSPTNTCTAPNTCNTTVDDHSVVNAPTYAQPATAYVSPVVQTVPYYTAQAYIPSYSTYTYPTYTSPSYVYTNPYVASVAPAVNPNPYVALTQIPYTGLDLGFFGNALYWLALIGVALAGAYLLVYYLPSLKFRQANSLGDTLAISQLADQGVTSESAEETPCNQPAGGPRSHLGSTYGGTNDMMQVIKSAHGGAPRIVISRN